MYQKSFKCEAHSRKNKKFILSDKLCRLFHGHVSPPKMNKTDIKIQHKDFYVA